MRRIFLAAAAVAASLLLAPVGVAQAHGSPQGKVRIQPAARYHTEGVFVVVELVASCTGGTSLIYGLGEVTLTQDYPETQFPEAHGVGGDNIACDGKPHNVAVTVGGLRFDCGKAWAEAKLNSPGGVAIATDRRRITIYV